MKLVEKNRQEIDNRIREYGEAAAYEIGAQTSIRFDEKIMGRLQFRTSHSQEAFCVTPLKLPNFLVLLLASWSERKCYLARRAGYLCYQ